MSQHLSPETPSTTSPVMSQADAAQRLFPTPESRESHASDVADLNALLRSLANDSPLLLLAIRQDGTLAFISGAVERILGEPPAARLNTQVLDWIHPDEVERAILQMAATSSTGPAPGITRFRVRHRDGSWKDLEIFGALVSDGLEEYIGIYARDAANQLFLEDVLTLLLNGAGRRESLLPVLNAMQWHSVGSQVAISYFDGKQFCLVSHGLDDALGGAGGSQGTTDSPHGDGVEPDPWTRCRETKVGVEGSASQLDPIRRALAEEVGLDEFWIEPVDWGNDQPPATVTIWTAAGSGVTPQVHSYGMGAARYLTELIMRWTQQGLDLDRATRQLVSQEKLASLGTLTAGVAHEIRNPLSFIKNFAEASMESATDLVAEIDAGTMDASTLRTAAGELVDSLEVIARHVKRIDSIVANMLGYSQQQPGPPQATDVGDLVRTFAELGYQGFRGSGHSEFRVRLEVDVLPGVMAMLRPHEIGRVIVNLVDNACHALLQLAIRGIDRPPAVIVTVRQVDKHLRISVRDNGIGLAQGESERIFEPFYTTKAPGEGTGLGLSLCRDIVELHGGELSVVSTPQHSTTFTLDIPWMEVENP